MPPLKHMSELVRSSQLSQPRTILAFLFGIATILLSAFVVVGVALVSAGEPILGLACVGAAGLVVVGIVIAVFRQTKSDPAGLMLGQVNASEYRSIRRLTQGDSLTGEQVEMVAEGFVVEPDQIAAAPDAGGSARQIEPPEPSGGKPEPDVNPKPPGEDPKP